MFKSEELYPLNKNFPPSILSFFIIYKTVWDDFLVDVEIKILTVSIGYMIAAAVQPPITPAPILEPTFWEDNRLLK